RDRGREERENLERKRARVADAAVESLLDNIQQLLIYHTHLIGDAKNQVEKLGSDLRLFKAFLRDSTKKRRKDESLRELVRQIRDVVYEAEDIVDAFVTQAAGAESKSKSYFLRARQTPLKLHGIATEIERVSAKVKDIYGDETRIDFANLIVGDGGPDESE
ncbi:UNVERIFIED_CONTAM: putative disease resistance protein, partial [Sesamum latifolium]